MNATRLHISESAHLTEAGEALYQRLADLNALSGTQRKQLDDIAMLFRGRRARKPDDRAERLQELQLRRRDALQAYYETVEEIERVSFLPAEVA